MSKYKTEYKTTFQLIFRIDNWIRFVGAALIVGANLLKSSTVQNDYIGTVQSDVILIIIGVAITIIGPDARKLLINKFGAGEKP